MQCPKCGTQMPDNAKFCEECGTPLAQSAAEAPGAAQSASQPPAPTTEPVFVPAAAQPSYPANYQAPAPQPKGKLSTGAIVGIVIGAVAVIAIIIGIALFAFGGQKEDVPVASSSQAVEAVEEEEAVEEPSEDEANMQKLVGWWDGADERGTHIMVVYSEDGIGTAYLEDGTEIESGPYDVDGDMTYIYGSTDTIDYKFSFINNDNTLCLTYVPDNTTITLNRMTQSQIAEAMKIMAAHAADAAAQQAAADAAAAAAAEAAKNKPQNNASPYAAIAGTWAGNMQDGTYIKYEFGSDQHFQVYYDGAWQDDGPYDIVGNKLILRGMDGSETWIYWLENGGNTLMLSAPAVDATFTFRRV